MQIIGKLFSNLKNLLLLQMADRGQRYQRSERQRSRDRLTNKQPSTSPFKQGSSRHQNNKNTTQSHQQPYSHVINKNIQNLTELNKVIQNLPIPIKNSQVQFLSPYFQRFILTNDLKNIFKTFFRMFVKASPQQAIYKSFYSLLKSGKNHLQQVLKKYTAIIRSIIEILCQKFQDKYIEHVKNDKNWEQFLFVSAYNETTNFKSYILLIKKLIQKQISISSEIIKTYYEIIINLIQQNFLQIPLVSNSTQKQCSQKIKNVNKKSYRLLPMIIRQIECVLMKRFKSQVHTQIIKYIQEIKKFQNQLINGSVQLINGSVQLINGSVQLINGSVQQKQKSIYLRYNTIVFLIMFQCRISPQFYTKLLSRYFVQNIINKELIKNNISKQKQQSVQQEDSYQSNQYINTQYSLGVLSRFFVKDYLNFYQNKLLIKNTNETPTRNYQKQNEEIQKVELKKDKQTVINTDILSQNTKMKASSNLTVNMYHKLLFALLIQKQKSCQKDKQQKQRQQNCQKDYKQSMAMEQELQELGNKQNQYRQKQQKQPLIHCQELNLINTFILLSPFRISKQEVQFDENYMKIKQKMLSTRNSCSQTQNNHEQLQLEQQLSKYKQNQHQPLPITQKVFSRLLSTQIQVLFEANHHLFQKLINLLESSKMSKQQLVQQNQSNNNNSNNINNNAINISNNNEFHEFDLQEIFVHNNCHSFNIWQNKQINNNENNNKPNTILSMQNTFIFGEVRNQLKTILKQCPNQNFLSNHNQNHFIKSFSSQSDIPFIAQSCFKFVAFTYLLIKNQTIQKVIMQIRKYHKQNCQNLIASLKNKNRLNIKSGSVQRNGLSVKSGSVQRNGLGVKSSSVQRFQKIQKEKSQQRQKVGSSSLPLTQLNKKQKKQMLIQVQQKQSAVKNIQNQQQAQIKELMQKFKKQGVRQLQNIFSSLLKILFEQVLSRFTFKLQLHLSKANSTNKNKYKKMALKSIIQLAKQLTHDIKIYVKKSQNQFQSPIQLLNKPATNKNNLTQKQQEEKINFQNTKFIIEIQQAFCVKQCEALAWHIKRLQQSIFYEEQDQCQNIIEGQHSNDHQNGQMFSLKRLLFPNKKNTIFQKLTQITKLQLKLQQVSDQNHLNVFSSFDNKKPSSFYQEVIIKKKIELYQKQLLTQVSTSILYKQSKNDIYDYQKAEEILYELFRFSINNEENYQKIFTMNLSSNTGSYEKTKKNNNQIIYSTMIKLLDFGKSTKKTLKELSFQTIPKCQKISSQILTFLTDTLKNTQLLNSKIRKLIFMFYDKVNQHTISTFIQNRKLFTLQAMIASNYKMKTLAEVLLKEEINSKQLQILFLNSNSVLENNNDDQQVLQSSIDEQNQQNLKAEQKKLDIVKLYLKFLVNKDGPALKYQLNQRLKIKNSNLNGVYKDLYQKISQIDIE